MSINYTETEVKRFNNILNDYLKIQSDGELEKRKLEYNDYKELGFIIDCLRYDKQACVDSKNIAEWLKTFGCIVNVCGNTFKIQL